MTETESMIMRLRGAGMRDVVNELERRGKVIDALTVKLNKVLNEQYLSEMLLKERIDALEHRLARMGARVEQLRYVAVPAHTSSTDEGTY